ncbi:MAG: hypothetical protein GY745_16395 [Actinomycetia bacterium]|nr:hypothetical protein [Actinomycetes bacterium]
MLNDGVDVDTAALQTQLGNVVAEARRELDDRRTAHDDELAVGRDGARTR